MSFIKEVIDRNITYRYYNVEEIKDNLSACKWILRAKQVFDSQQRLRIRKSEFETTDFSLNISVEDMCERITDEHIQIDALGIYKGAHIYIIVSLKDFTVSLVRQNREENVFSDLEQDLILV